MNLTKAVLRAIRIRGFKGTVQSIVTKYIPLHIKNLEQYRVALSGSMGLEIGGPTPWFGERGSLPVYSVLKNLDNCTFARSTMWGTFNQGTTYRFDKNKPPGHQFISEASDLHEIETGSYDCLLASHALEHLANPIKGLFEWRRVIREGGHLLLVVPHRDGTFDHRRPVTTLQHMVEDFENNTDERDMTHLDEVISLHDVGVDPAVKDIPSFRERCLHNHENRCLHHHVFDSELAIRLLDYTKFQVLAVDPGLPFNINILARKPRHSDRVDNQSYLMPQASYRKRSPFKSDRP